MMTKHEEEMGRQSDRLHARIAALEAEVAKLEVGLMDLAASGAHRIASAEAALATARADALEEAARVADEWANKDTKAEQYDDEMMLKAEAHAGEQIAYAIRALALTQPASTQPLTDQGETSTAGEVAPKDGEYKYPGSDWYRDNVGGGAEP